jgi:diguanylate cyclase (GGDEF)-like protein/PAS domain S-box-containing protein
MLAQRVAAPLPEAPGAWHSIIDSLIEAVWLVDATTLRIVDANANAARLVGVPVAELVGRDVQALVATPEDLQYWSDVAAGIREPIHSDSFVRRFEGTLVPVTRRVSYMRAASRGGVYVVAMHDRSEQRRVEEECESLLADLQSTLESTADGILVIDLSGRIRAFNRRFATLWNLPEELLVKRDDAAVRQWMRRSVAEPAAFAQRLAAIEEATMLQTSDVITLHSGRVLERLTMPQCSRGQPVGRVYSFRDLSERVAAKQRIQELAHTDPLTGLPNRLLLASRFEYALAMARRDAVPFATLILDVDRFGHLNDTFGQQLGDRVLIEVADRIKACLRQVDTVARLGGDQFVLLIHGADVHGAEGSARRLLDCMRRPFVLDGMSFTVTCSIGIALHTADGETMDELIRQANGAMMQVKQAGRASYRFHRSQDDVDMRARIRLDHAMRQGLERGDFRLHYQPQVYMASGSIIGAEALLRWTDPEMGEVPPGDFIPVAEDSGFIVALGHWVLSQAVNQAAAWHAAGLGMPVSINVSALQFRQHDFVGQVATALRSAGLPAHLLELELTESILLVDAGEGLARLRALADIGVRLAIDDFGTGYSSLGYLKRFPISRLKIDRSFVRGLPGDEIDEGITQAVIDLGRALKLQVIAEGVETEEQRRFLQEAGCSQYQGFLCAPALPREAFERLLRATLDDAPGAPGERRAPAGVGRGRPA